MTGVFAWVTLATNDSYSLGALVLAHSLRKAGTAHKLAVLITPAVSQPIREQLESVFDQVKVVDVLDSKDEANLALLKRPELGITFTKIHCWKLTDYEKCVFLDADTLVVRNCDELFEREELSAAPDVGWPDCFNTGVFVYKPSDETFTNILKLAEGTGSFDGGDQGLLNEYFSDWASEDIKKHLPFVYNLTSVAVYSYIPAFKRYGSQIRIVHFIGVQKPWLQQVDPTTRIVTPEPGAEHLTPLLQVWWDLFSEKVYPNLSKNVEYASGMLHLQLAACPNSITVESCDEPQPASLIQPFTPYIEPDDSRQINLPYQPFEVQSSSGELLNYSFLLAREKEMAEQHQEEEPTREEQPEPPETSQVEPQPQLEPEPEPESGFQQEEEPSRQEETHHQESTRSLFDYYEFVPDESCINNYLEQNTMFYQPFDSQNKSFEPLPVVNENPFDGSDVQSLPRFLTIPEDDRRQSFNVSHSNHWEPEYRHEHHHHHHHDHQHHNRPEHHHQHQTEPQYIPPPQHHDHVHIPPPEGHAAHIPHEHVHISAPEEPEGGGLQKSKSLSNLLKDLNITDTMQAMSAWKSQPNVNADTPKKYVMPKLKPLLPKQSPPHIPVNEYRPKVTQYTEFHMSSDYKEPEGLPRDELGFVERHILKESPMRLSKSENNLVGNTLPEAYVVEQLISETRISPKKFPPGTVTEITDYDLSSCKRQSGNKPPPNYETSSRKRRGGKSKFALPGLKPLVPPGQKKETFKRKNSDERLLVSEDGSEIERQKNEANKENVVQQEIYKETKNVDEILNRLIDYTKGYDDYFKVCAAEEATSQLEGQVNGTKSSLVSPMILLNSSEVGGEDLLLPSYAQVNPNESSETRHEKMISSISEVPPSWLNGQEVTVKKKSGRSKIDRAKRKRRDVKEQTEENESLSASKKFAPTFPTPEKFVNGNGKNIMDEVETHAGVKDTLDEQKPKEVRHLKPAEPDKKKGDFREFRSFVKDRTESSQKGLLGVQDIEAPAALKRFTSGMVISHASVSSIHRADKMRPEEKLLEKVAVQEEVLQKSLQVPPTEVDLYQGTPPNTPEPSSGQELEPFAKSDEVVREITERLDAMEKVATLQVSEMTGKDLGVLESSKSETEPEVSGERDKRKISKIETPAVLAREDAQKTVATEDKELPESKRAEEVLPREEKNVPKNQKVKATEDKEARGSQEAQKELPTKDKKVAENLNGQQVLPVKETEVASSQNAQEVLPAEEKDVPQSQEAQDVRNSCSGQEVLPNEETEVPQSQEAQDVGNSCSGQEVLPIEETEVPQSQEAQDVGNSCSGQEVLPIEETEVPQSQEAQEILPTQDNEVPKMKSEPPEVSLNAAVASQTTAAPAGALRSSKDIVESLKALSLGPSGSSELGQACAGPSYAFIAQKTAPVQAQLDRSKSVFAAGKPVAKKPRDARKPRTHRDKPRVESTPKLEETKPDEIQTAKPTAKKPEKPSKVTQIDKPANIFELLPDMPKENSADVPPVRKPSRSTALRSPLSHPANTSGPSQTESTATDPEERLADPDDSSGIAGAIANLCLGTKAEESAATSTAATTSQDEYLRRLHWETGNMDYMGQDSFEHIWSKICQTIDGQVLESTVDSPAEEKNGSAEWRIAESSSESAGQSTALEHPGPVSLSMILDPPPSQAVASEALPSDSSSVAVLDDEDIIFSQPTERHFVLSDITELELESDSVLEPPQPPTELLVETAPTVVEDAGGAGSSTEAAPVEDVAGVSEVVSVASPKESSDLKQLADVAAPISDRPVEDLGVTSPERTPPEAVISNQTAAEPSVESNFELQLAAVVIEPSEVLEPSPIELGGTAAVPKPTEATGTEAQVLPSKLTEASRSPVPAGVSEAEVVEDTVASSPSQVETESTADSIQLVTAEPTPSEIISESTEIAAEVSEPPQAYSSETIPKPPEPSEPEVSPDPNSLELTKQETIPESSETAAAPAPDVETPIESVPPVTETSEPPAIESEQLTFTPEVTAPYPPEPTQTPQSLSDKGSTVRQPTATPDAAESGVPATSLPAPQSKSSNSKSKDEGKQKKGVITKILEFVGVTPKPKKEKGESVETANSVFYDLEDERPKESQTVEKRTETQKNKTPPPQVVHEPPHRVSPTTIETSFVSASITTPDEPAQVEEAKASPLLTNETIDEVLKATDLSAISNVTPTDSSGEEVVQELFKIADDPTLQPATEVGNQTIQEVAALVEAAEKEIIKEVEKVAAEVVEPVPEKEIIVRVEDVVSSVIAGVIEVVPEKETTEKVVEIVSAVSAETAEPAIEKDLTEDIKGVVGSVIDRLTEAEPEKGITEKTVEVVSAVAVETGEPAIKDVTQEIIEVVGSAVAGLTEAEPKKEITEKVQEVISSGTADVMELATEKDFAEKIPEVVSPVVAEVAELAPKVVDEVTEAVGLSIGKTCEDTIESITGRLVSLTSDLMNIKEGEGAVETESGDAPKRDDDLTEAEALEISKVVADTFEKIISVLTDASNSPEESINLSTIAELPSNPQVASPVSEQTSEEDAPPDEKTVSSGEKKTPIFLETNAPDIDEAFLRETESLKSEIDRIIEEAKSRVEAKLSCLETESVESKPVSGGRKDVEEDEEEEDNFHDTNDVICEEEEPVYSNVLKTNSKMVIVDPPDTKRFELEEIKVTSDEERRKHKGQQVTSKLSGQILRAIPPPRRKAISNAKTLSQQTQTGTIPKTKPTEESEAIAACNAVEGQTPPPVPPRRNRSKQRQPPLPPPKRKTKK